MPPYNFTFAEVYSAVLDIGKRGIKRVGNVLQHPLAGRLFLHIQLIHRGSQAYKDSRRFADCSHGNGVLTLCCIVLDFEDNRINEVCRHATHWFEGCIIAVFNSRREGCKVKSLWNIYRNGLVFLINDTRVDIVYLETLYLGFITFHANRPVKQYISVGHTNDLRCRHIEFIAHFDVAFGTVADSKCGHSHIFNGISLWNAYCNRTVCRVNSALVLVEFQALQCTIPIELQVRNVAVAA